MSNKKNILAGISITILLTYQLWAWIFAQTIWKNESINYIFFLGSALLFLYILFRDRIVIEKKVVGIWLPSLIYILLYAALAIFAEKIAWWFCCLSLILIAVNEKITSIVPQKLFVFCGLYGIVGIWVQMFFPQFYFSYINPLFIKADLLENWIDAYGFSGFTYQLDTTAFFIMYFEAIWLYHYKKRVKGWLYWIILILSVLSIFLTGKRSISVIAVITPILVYVLSLRKQGRTTIYAIIFGLIGFLLVEYFISNSSYFSDNLFLRRFSDTVESARLGGDIESGREDLRAMAVKAWLSKPIFGIGLANYQTVTGAYTDVHNAYLQVLCEQGVVGFTLWIIPLLLCPIYTFKALRRSSGGSIENQWLKFSLFLQIQFILYGFTGNPMSNSDRFIMYFLSIAVLAEMRYKLYRSNSNRRSLSGYKEKYGNRIKISRTVTNVEGLKI